MTSSSGGGSGGGGGPTWGPATLWYSQPWEGSRMPTYWPAPAGFGLIAWSLYLSDALASLSDLSMVVGWSGFCARARRTLTPLAGVVPSARSTRPVYSYLKPPSTFTQPAAASASVSPVIIRAIIDP